MNINTSTSTYNALLNSSDNVANTAAAQTSSASRQASTSGPQISLSGKGIMMSRLFGDTDANPPVQTQLTKTTISMSSLNFLTNDDRNTLSNLYAQAQAQGTDMRYIDDLAHDLGNYRMFSGVMANANGGKIFDSEGRVQTFKFTQSDAATAARIQNSAQFSRSQLDTGFLNYELDPGFSFAHQASFAFLEAVVSGQPFDAQFAAYQHPEKNNYIIETSSEVTLKTEEPDWRNDNGVVTVTETGLKHGFRLVNGEVVQATDDVLHNLVTTPKTLLDFLTRNKNQQAN